MESEPGRTLSGEAINPPRLEDAGLEDCALPLQSILEAFSKAASISRFSDSVDDTTDEEDEGSDVDPTVNTAEGSPIQKLKREGQEKVESTGDETPLLKTGEEGCAESDEKKCGLTMKPDLD